jgi:hypothetical protein
MCQPSNADQHGGPCSGGIKGRPQEIASNNTFYRFIEFSMASFILQNVLKMSFFGL